MGSLSADEIVIAILPLLFMIGTVYVIVRVLYAVLHRANAPQQEVLLEIAQNLGRIERQVARVEEQLAHDRDESLK